VVDVVRLCGDWILPPFPPFWKALLGVSIAISASWLWCAHVNSQPLTLPHEHLHSNEKASEIGAIKRVGAVVPHDSLLAFCEFKVSK
jgi:hypothetical protein